MPAEMKKISMPPNLLNYDWQSSQYKRIVFVFWNPYNLSTTTAGHKSRYNLSKTREIKTRIVIQKSQSINNESDFNVNVKNIVHDKIIDINHPSYYSLLPTSLLTIINNSDINFNKLIKTRNCLTYYLTAAAFLCVTFLSNCFQVDKHLLILSKLSGQVSSVYERYRAHGWLATLGGIKYHLLTS